MKWHLARILRRFADRLDPLDPTPNGTSWWVDPAQRTSSTASRVTVYFTPGHLTP